MERFNRAYPRALEHRPKHTIEITHEGRQVYATLKMLHVPVCWEGQAIIVQDVVKISPPYTAADCEGLPTQPCVLMLVMNLLDGIHVRNKRQEENQRTAEGQATNSSSQESASEEFSQRYTFASTYGQGRWEMMPHGRPSYRSIYESLILQQSRWDTPGNIEARDIHEQLGEIMHAQYRHDAKSGFHDVAISRRDDRIQALEAERRDLSRQLGEKYYELVHTRAAQQKAEDVVDHMKRKLAGSSVPASGPVIDEEK